MNLPLVIQECGYPAIFVGTYLEGESIVVAAGIAAHAGMLSLPLVAALAAAGSFLGDQLFYWLGRRYGGALLPKLPRFATAVGRARALLVRHQSPLILSVRFIYGLRIAGPAAIGISGVAPRRFFALNLAGALLWASLVSAVGYGVGAGVTSATGKPGVGVWGVVAILGGFLLPWLLAASVRRLRRN